MNALIVLCKNLKPELENFYKNISRENYDLFFLVGDNLSKLISNDEINYIQIDDVLIRKHGYHTFNSAVNKTKKYNAFSQLWDKILYNLGVMNQSNAPISAWDKAIFYFCTNINKSYNFIWFIEDDVFLPDINLFEKIDKEYLNEDIISAQNIINQSGEIKSWYWWKFIRKKNLPLPWAHSMVCSVRLSKKLIRVLSLWVSANKNSHKFIEYIFHTLALHNNLNVKIINNLKYIEWKGGWTKRDLNINNLYHPVKSIEDQIEFRKYLKDAIK